MNIETRIRPAIAVVEIPLPRGRTYTPAARRLHWLTVALIGVQAALGWVMPDAHRHVPPDWLNVLHMTLGFALLGVILARVVLRIFVRAPRPEPGTPGWTATVAGFMHLGLYELVILIVLTGWATATAHGWPISLFALVPLPRFLPDWWALHDFGNEHAVMVWILIAAVAVHAAAALWHHFVLRDRTLRRMLGG
jgi:cytochrome b561